MQRNSTVRPSFNAVVTCRSFVVGSVRSRAQGTLKMQNKQDRGGRFSVRVKRTDSGIGGGRWFAALGGSTPELLGRILV